MFHQFRIKTVHTIAMSSFHQSQWEKRSYHDPVFLDTDMDLSEEIHTVPHENKEAVIFKRRERNPLKIFKMEKKKPKEKDMVMSFSSVVSPPVPVLPSMLSRLGLEVVSPLREVSVKLSGKIKPSSHINNIPPEYLRPQNLTSSYLYTSIFKILHEEDRFIEAGKILVAMKSPYVYKYLTIKRLWNYFSIFSSVDDKTEPDIPFLTRGRSRSLSSPNQANHIHLPMMSMGNNKYSVRTVSNIYPIHLKLPIEKRQRSKSLVPTRTTDDIKYSPPNNLPERVPSKKEQQKPEKKTNQMSQSQKNPEKKVTTPRLPPKSNSHISEISLSSVNNSNNTRHRQQSEKIEQTSGTNHTSSHHGQQQDFSQMSFDTNHTAYSHLSTRLTEPPNIPPKPRRSFVSVRGQDKKKKTLPLKKHPMNFTANRITIHKLRSYIAVDSPRCLYNVIRHKLKGSVTYEDFCEKYLLLTDLLDLDLRATLKHMAKAQDQLTPNSVLPLFEGIDPNITILYLRMCWMESIIRKVKPT
jgi:hypothetical protein